MNYKSIIKLLGLISRKIYQLSRFMGSRGV
nr:MAG TPA: hypothetical protein [Caudoviricetes sp.]